MASPELDRLGQEVSEISTVVDSAVTLLNGLGQFVRDHVNDPAALTAFADGLDSKAGELGAAVAANTQA